MFLAGCNHPHHSPELMFAAANQDFLQGYLNRSQTRAHEGYEEFLHSNPKWAWEFRILEAKAALWRGLYNDVFNTLGTLPDFNDRPEFAVQKLTLLGVANVNIHNFSEAERLLDAATALCDHINDVNCGYLLQARGLLASEQGHSPEAENLYGLSLQFARAHGDRFLEADSLLNLGDESLTQGRFDEAIDQSQDGYEIAKAGGAKSLQLVLEGNIGWAYYKLGDSEKALDMALQSEQESVELGDILDEENTLTNIGYVYMDEGRLDLAAKSFQEALELAKGIKAEHYIYNAQRVLARLALRANDPAKAKQYADASLESARRSENAADELYPKLVQAQIEARGGDAPAAQKTFQEVANDRECPESLKWEAQHSLALLYQDQGHADLADRQYRASLATFEAARATVRHEDSQLSFLTNASSIYDDYIHFLIGRGQVEQALRWADYSRARTLTEGLGLLPKSTSKPARNIEPPALQLQNVAAHANGTILFYWMGETQSYLWMITNGQTRVFPLPPAAEISNLVERYRRLLVGPEDPLDSGNDEGRKLYRMLVAPAEAFLRKDKKVFVIADGNLNNLNFETLVVPAPKPHYWIEDEDVVNASSIRVLAASFENEKTPSRRLLLIGDSIPPNDDYPALPQAANQMASVGRAFPATDETVYEQGTATPVAYLDSNPEKFSYIHFVAHGTASRLSPLDSAIILSRESGSTDSFKLYARDIVAHPLSAKLVTISACYGAGERSYRGEGLVGLAWAFLRAGAHNVVAALWDASDASTNQLMGQFYAGLSTGHSPDVALRDAKLSQVHSNSAFRKPFYWAPFQLYTGR